MLAQRAKKWLEDAEAKGRIEALRTGVIGVLEARFDIVSPSVRKAIGQSGDQVVLRSLLRQAAVVESMRVFRELLK